MFVSSCECKVIQPFQMSDCLTIFQGYGPIQRFIEASPYVCIAYKTYIHTYIYVYIYDQWLSNDANWLPSTGLSFGAFNQATRLGLSTGQARPSLDWYPRA